MYHELNIDDFLQTLKDTPWDLCFSDPPDVDYAWNKFKDWLLDDSLHETFEIGKKFFFN